jgi:hypothetical protein
MITVTKPSPNKVVYRKNKGRRNFGINLSFGKYQFVLNLEVLNTHDAYSTAGPSLTKSHRAGRGGTPAVAPNRFYLCEFEQAMMAGSEPNQ